MQHERHAFPSAQNGGHLLAMKSSQALVERHSVIDVTAKRCCPHSLARKTRKAGTLHANCWKIWHPGKIDSPMSP